MPLEHCEEHNEFIAMLHRIDKNVVALDAKVDNALGIVNGHVTSGGVWRVTIATIGAGWLISIVVLAFYLGGIDMQVKVNTNRWDRLLERNPVVVATLENGSIERHNLSELVKD
jgi:hypothetical protein